MSHLLSKTLSGAVLALLLTGCATQTQKVLVRELPPPELLRECLHPSIDVETNADLANGIMAYSDALELCNVDKRALQDWANKQ